MALETLEHFESRSGIKTKDLDIVTQQTASGSVSLDEPKIENLKLWSMASVIDESAQSASSEDNGAYVAIQDAWIDLGFVDISAAKVTDDGETVTFTFATDLVTLAAHGFSDGQKVEFNNSGGGLPAEILVDTTYYIVNSNPGDFQISLTPGGSVHAFTDDGTGTNKVLELYTILTDYELDLNAGLLYALSEGAIGASEAIEVSFSYAAVTKKEVKAGTSTTIIGHLFFAGDPAIGRKQDLKGKISLKPDGDLPFIGDEIEVFNFNFDFILENDNLFQIIDRGVVT